jgi:lysophospholipid acyltransferase 1/2
MFLITRIKGESLIFWHFQNFVLKKIPLKPLILLDDDFVENTSLFGKTLFILLSTTFARMKYYHAWLLADAICNASGLGFNGYTASGKAKWDLISNVDILKFEV